MLVSIKSNKKLFSLWLVLTCFFAFQFLPRLFIGLIRDDIFQIFKLDNIHFGQIVGIYYVGYALMHLPFGMLLDRYHLMHTALISTLGITISIIYFTLSKDWIDLFTARFIMGSSSAASLIMVIKFLSTFPNREKANFFYGISFAIGLIGVLFSGIPMYYVFVTIGYTNTLIVLSIFSILLTITILITTNIDNEIKLQNTPNITIESITKVLLNPNIILTGISAGFMMGFAEGFTGIWSILFYTKICSFSYKESIFISSFIAFGTFIGSFIIVPIKKNFRSDNHVMIFICIAMICIYFTLFLLKNYSLYIHLLIMLLIGILCSYQVLLFGITSKFVNNEQIATAISVVHCLKMILGYFFHLIISNFMPNDALNTLDHGKLTMTFFIALSPIPISCIISILIFYYLNNKY